MKWTTRTRILFLVPNWCFSVSNRHFFRWLDWNSPYNIKCVGEITCLRKVKQFSWEFSSPTSIHDDLYYLLTKFAFKCIRILSYFLCFSVIEKVEIRYINAGPDFLGYYSYYSSSTDFLNFKLLRTQPFHAWLNTEFKITKPDLEYGF